MKSVKKEEKEGELSQKHVLRACTQMLVKGFIPRENMFSVAKKPFSDTKSMKTTNV